MLFDRNIEPCCAYCRFGLDMGGDEVACVKHGIMTATGCCRMFSYEPTKRVPEAGPRVIQGTDLTEDDFSL